LWLEFNRKPIEQRVLVVVVVVVVIVDTLLSSLAKCFLSFPFLPLPSFLPFLFSIPQPFLCGDDDVKQRKSATILWLQISSGEEERGEGNGFVLTLPRLARFSFL
jgi:hypothetical protein